VRGSSRLSLKRLEHVMSNRTTSLSPGRTPRADRAFSLDPGCGQGDLSP